MNIFKLFTKKDKMPEDPIKTQLRREDLLEQIRTGNYKVSTKELSDMSMPIGKAYDRLSKTLKKVAKKSGLKL